MVKKPRHDPATAWKKPGQSAYQRYATPAMAPGTPITPPSNWPQREPIPVGR